MCGYSFRQTSFLHEGNSLLCVQFRLNSGQCGREGVGNCLQGNPAVRRPFLPGGKQWLGTVSPAVTRAVLTLICKVFDCKEQQQRCCAEYWQPRSRCPPAQGWPWLPGLWQPTFYGSAAKQLGACMSAVGKLLPDYP